MTATRQLLERLSSIETATIGHFLSDGFMPPEIQCVTEGVRVAGPAMTVSLPGDDGSALSLAISSAKAGDILVVERGDDRRHACWGAVMTAAAKAVGIVGVVIDGYVTDLSAIRASGLPVWCKGRSPITTKLRGGGEVGKPVRCGGLDVQPGDIVLADENGVFSAPEMDMLAIVDQAAAIQDREPEIIARIQAGEPLAKIYGHPEKSAR